MESVQQFQAPQIPPSMFQLSEMLAQEMNQISGVNEELLGMDQDDLSGIATMLRQGASITTLQTFFDNLDRSQKILGELSISMIQQNFSAGKIRRILNEEPSEQFYNNSFQKFDAAVGEGDLTETQRKASFAALLEMLKIGLPIPPHLLLEKAPIPDKKELLETITAQQQQQLQAQQQMQQLQAAEIQSRIKLAEARATADTGLGIERLSRIDENKELAKERRAQAIENISDARLNRAKAIKELDSVDLDQVKRAIEIIQMLSPTKEEKAEVGESLQTKTKE